jgi:hypothetical protein
VVVPKCLLCNPAEGLQGSTWCQQSQVLTELTHCTLAYTSLAALLCCEAQNMQSCPTSINSNSSALALTAPCGSLGAARRLSAPPPVIPTARPVTALPCSAVFEPDCPMPPRWHLTRCLQLLVCLHYVVKGTVRQKQVLKGWETAWQKHLCSGLDSSTKHSTTQLLAREYPIKPAIRRYQAPETLTSQLPQFYSLNMHPPAAAACTWAKPCSMCCHQHSLLCANGSAA